MARILIVGTGDIGGHLAEQLVSGGHEVWGMRRSDKPLADGIELLIADVADRDTIPTLPENLDIVVYSIASPVFSKDGYHDYYVKGLKNILRRLKGQSPKRVIFVSSSSVYHQMNGEWVDELSETAPTSFAGKEMLLAEQTLLESSFPGTACNKLANCFYIFVKPIDGEDVFIVHKNE